MGEWRAALIRAAITTRVKKCRCKCLMLRKFLVFRLKDHEVRQFLFSDAIWIKILKYRTFQRITASQTGPDLILTIITLSWDGIGPQVIAIVIIPNNLYNEPPLNYRIYFILRIWPSCFIKEKSTKSKESNKTEKTDHAPHRTLRVVLSKVSFLACDMGQRDTWHRVCPPSRAGIVTRGQEGDTQPLRPGPRVETTITIVTTNSVMTLLLLETISA